MITELVWGDSRDTHKHDLFILSEITSIIIVYIVSAIHE